MLLQKNKYGVKFGFLTQQRKCSIVEFMNWEDFSMCFLTGNVVASFLWDNSSSHVWNCSQRLMGMDDQAKDMRRKKTEKLGNRLNCTSRSDNLWYNDVVEKMSRLTKCWHQKGESSGARTTEILSLDEFLVNTTKITPVPSHNCHVVLDLSKIRMLAFKLNFAINLSKTKICRRLCYQAINWLISKRALYL